MSVMEKRMPLLIDSTVSALRSFYVMPLAERRHLRYCRLLIEYTSSPCMYVQASCSPSHINHGNEVAV